MNSQEDQVSFFERLSSEMGFPSTTPGLQEIIASINSSLATHLIYTNLSSGETLEGSFYLERSLLVYQAEALELPEIILDLSYARLHTIFRFNQKAGTSKIYLEKNQNTYELMFAEESDYEDWMLKLKKFCVLTNFDKKYHIAEIIEKRENIYECLLETKMGGNHFAARLFDKKHIISSQDSFAMIHLMNEIEILKSLGNKRVLSLLEVHETEDSIYLVTDCIQNMTLKEILKTLSYSFPEGKMKTIMYQLLKTLAHMASMKIIHRNLKPSNILIEEKDNIRITNFGLATYINGPKANVGICGTPGYIAPEIFNCCNEDQIYDEKVDVFSVGCIFFEMLFGFPLFEGSNGSEISTSNKNFKFCDLVHLVIKEKQTHKPHSTKLGLDLLLKLLHNDTKQRISAEEALRDAYFCSMDSAPPKKVAVDESDSNPRNYKGKSNQSTPKDRRQKASFEISSHRSNSLKGSSSETRSQRKTATLYPGNSFKRLPEGSTGKCISPSSFKNQTKFKSAEEMKIPTPPKRLNYKISSETLIVQRIHFTNQKEEDIGEIFDESSPSSLLKNLPIHSPRIQKHPNQRIKV